MAHFLFVDESGYDSGESPYGVLGGAAVEDRELWSVVKDIRAAELKHLVVGQSTARCSVSRANSTHSLRTIAFRWPASAWNRATGPDGVSLPRSRRRKSPTSPNL
jgi:hypothetical protein